VAIRLGEVMSRPLFSQGYSAFERGMMPEASEAQSRRPFGVRAKTQDRPAYAQAQSYLTEMRKRLEAERSSLQQIEAHTQGMARSILEELDVAQREVTLIQDIVLPQDLSTYRLTLTNYSTGEATFLDLLDAERALIASRLDLHESRRVLNRTSLELATIRGRF
jgi:outer membrane protein TolC